jgi:hypothetical protein
MKALRLPAPASPVAYGFRFRGPCAPPSSCLAVALLEDWRSLPGQDPLFRRRSDPPAIPHMGLHGISQVPRRSIPRPCPAPRPRPNQRALATYRARQCRPRDENSEGFGGRGFRGLPLGFSTCCLRFTNTVAGAHARLASGWLARLYRKGVEPSGSLQKVSDHSSSSSGFILAQEG